MMTPNQEQKLLDSKASAIEKELGAAYDQFLELLDKGTAPRDAVSKVMKSFRGAYAKELAGGFREILQRSVGEKSVLEMRVAGISLSKRLYKESRATAAVVAGIVNRHAKGWQSARDLTLEIFEGYGFKDKEALNLSPRNPKLPKYLREELLVDPSVQGALARHFARAQALRLKTPALKAAYLEYLGAIETGAGRELLDKRLQTAFYERMRYFANRIAQTELHRAYADMQAREVMADEDVQFVQYRMSRTHPKTDICDLWAKQDLYGLGPGVYPKAQCPKAPQHPYCRCVCAPRLDIPVDAKTRLHPGASQDYLRSLDEREAAMVMGSKARLQAVLQGKDPLAVWNTNTDPMYRVRLVGDVAKAAGLGVDGGMSDAYNISKNGGKHSGWCKEMEAKSTSELQAGVQSFSDQIQRHKLWIENPSLKVSDWEQRDDRYKAGLIKKWEKDISRQEEQRDILKGILRSNGGLDGE